MKKNWLKGGIRRDIKTKEGISNVQKLKKNSFLAVIFLFINFVKCNKMKVKCGNFFLYYYMKITVSHVAVQKIIA